MTATVGSIQTRIVGVQATLSYTLDLVEHSRRRQCGGGALLSPDVLELLLGLPVGMPVQVAALSRRERGALVDAPPWAVEVVDGQAVRLAVAPVTVTLAVVVAKTWRTGLVAAGRFAPFCARTMVLEYRPPDDEIARMQADFYGVGITVARGDAVEVVVEPTPWRQMRWTAAGWRFRERVYEAVVRQMVAAAAEVASTRMGDDDVT